MINHQVVLAIQTAGLVIGLLGSLLLASVAFAFGLMPRLLIVAGGGLLAAAPGIAQHVSILGAHGAIFVIVIGFVCGILVGVPLFILGMANAYEELVPASRTPDAAAGPNLRAVRMSKTRRITIGVVLLQVGIGIQFVPPLMDLLGIKVV